MFVCALFVSFLTTCLAWGGVCDVWSRQYVVPSVNGARLSVSTGGCHSVSLLHASLPVCVSDNIELCSFCRCLVAAVGAVQTTSAVLVDFLHLQCTS